MGATATESVEGRVVIVIPGRPMPKQRPRVAMRGRKLYVYTPEETVEYEQRVALFARSAMRGREPFSGLVTVSIRLYLSEAAPVHSRRKTTPDVDNVAKAILDALGGIVYTDDRWVELGGVQRVWNSDEERAEVIVKPKY